MSDHFIIDPSILIQAYVQEPATENVLALLDGLKKPAIVTLHAPEFCLLECANILWRHVRFQGMPQATAEKAIRALVDLPMTIHLAATYLSDGLTIGLAQELPIYDSLYIALAKTLGFPLLTADSKQERAAVNAGVSIKPIDDFEPASTEPGEAG
jgi:predicted nucleic acid-binding protein